MANASTTKQKLESSIKNKIGASFDIDQSTSCKMTTDASQTMSGIKLSGSSNVRLKQLNDVQNLCYATSVAKLDSFNKLSSQTQRDIMKQAQQEGGLGINVTDTSNEIIDNVENEFGLDVAIDMSKDCLAAVNAPQTMEDIEIVNGINIDLSQESATFNKCIFDTATETAQEAGIDTGLITAVKEQSTQIGFDPIKSLSQLGITYIGALAFTVLMPVIISIIISVVLSTTMSSGARGISPPPGIPAMFNKQQTNPILNANIPAKFRKMLGGSISEISNIIKRKKTMIVFIVITIIIGFLLYKILSNVRKTTEKYANIYKNHRVHNNPQKYKNHLIIYPTEEIPEYIKRL